MLRTLLALGAAPWTAPYCARAFRKAGLAINRVRYELALVRLSVSTPKYFDETGSAAAARDAGDQARLTAFMYRAQLRIKMGSAISASAAAALKTRSRAYCPICLRCAA